MISERKEVQIKTALYRYILQNFVLEGKPILVHNKVMDLVDSMYELFFSLNPCKTSCDSCGENL